MNVLIRDLLSQIQLVHNAILADEINEEALLKTEALFKEISNQYGFDPDQKDEMSLVFEQKSIARLAELEAKMNSRDPVSSLQEQSKTIIEAVRSFWRKTGFNYIPDIKMNLSGILEVEFGFSLDYGSVFTSTAISDKEKNNQTKQRLIDEGYLLVNDSKDLLDCDQNKERITRLISEQFPEATIMSWNSRIHYQTDVMCLEKVHVYIHDSQDIIIQTKEAIEV